MLAKEQIVELASLSAYEQLLTVILGSDVFFTVAHYQSQTKPMLNMVFVDKNVKDISKITCKAFLELNSKDIKLNHR